MLANHKIIYIDGYNFRNQSNKFSHLYLQTRVFHCDFPQTDQQSSREKIFLNTLIYFEEREGYTIMIKKYQSVMLIEVINYDDKNVGTPSSKS